MVSSVSASMRSTQRSFGANRGSLSLYTYANTMGEVSTIGTFIFWISFYTKAHEPFNAEGSE